MITREKAISDALKKIKDFIFDTLDENINDYDLDEDFEKILSDLWESACDFDRRVIE